MEKYAQTLKKQNVFLVICIAILAIFCFLGFAGEFGLVDFLKPAAGDSHWQSKWRGFISGASFGIMALMVFGLVQNLQALKDEKKLKKLYIKEHDERAIQIWTAARAASMQVFLLGGIVACVVAGYFSATVSLTILVCILVHSLMGLGFKMYYSKKF